MQDRVGPCESTGVTVPELIQVDEVMCPLRAIFRGEGIHTSVEAPDFRGCGRMATEPPAVAGGSEVAERRTPNATILPVIAQKAAATDADAPAPTGAGSVTLVAPHFSAASQVGASITTDKPPRFCCFFRTMRPRPMLRNCKGMIGSRLRPRPYTHCASTSSPSFPISFAGHSISECCAARGSRD